MTNSRTTEWTLKSAVADEADFIIDAFENQIVETGAASIEDFVPAEHPQKSTLTFELIRVELEYRRRHDAAVSIADYLRKYPSELSDPKRLSAIAFDEYMMRCRGEENVDPREYQANYGIDTQDWPSASQVRAASDVDQRALSSDDGFPVAGDRVLDFQVLTEFGRGAFSRVYLAQEETLAKRLVVLKISRYFWAESQLLARLQHTNIVPIHSVHRTNEMQIVCMPFWGTCTLADILREVKDSPEVRSRNWSDAALVSTVANHQKETVVTAIASRDIDTKSQTNPPAPKPTEPNVKDGTTDYVEACLNFGIQIADGLNHAHQRGIVHSDLKPANVLIADDGRPMILDFNLAVDHRDARDNPVGGTLPYMSPEQLASLSDKESSQRPATDIYSLGVMLFELLVAQKPFPFRPGAVDKALQYMIADRKAVPSLRSLSPELPVGLCRVVEKCLAFEPAARYQSAAQVRDDLYRQLTNQPLSEVSEPLAERIQKAYRRSPRFAWGVMTVVLGIALAGALAAYSIQSNRAERNATLATVRQFESDATWLSSALSVSQIDAEERVGDWKRAETWIAKFDERRMPSTDRYLSPEQRRGIDRKLSELQYAMGSVRTKEAKSAADSKSREDLLLEALVLNEQAGTRLSSVPNALLSQREDILAMLGRSDSDQIAEGNDEDDSQQPKSAWQKRLIGMNLLDHGRAKAAIELFERSDGQQKNYADWAQLGNAYAMRRNPDQAVECFTACIALRPEIPFGYFQRGRAHMDAKQYARAARDFEQFLKLRPNSYSALGQHAAALTQLGRLSEARDQINIALLQKSDNANLHLLAAEIHHQLGNKERAKQSLGEAASLAAPDDARDFLANGMALLRDGKFQRAHDAFRLAHDSQPTSIAAIKNIAYVLSDHLHRLDEAIVWIDRALKLDPESAELISTKAVLLARSGNAGESREAMNEALRLDNDVTTLLRAASVYAITKANARDVTTSIEYTRRAMILDPAWASYIAEDPDLVGVRGDERFKEVIKAAMTLRERTH